MFKLPWSDLPPVNKELLEKHLNKMYDRSQNNDAFVVYLPITVYEHIKTAGINAHLIQLQKQAFSPGMVWIEVRKIERLCGKDEPCFEKGYCWEHFAKLMCKHLVQEKGRNSFFCKKIKERIKNNNIYLESKKMFRKTPRSLLSILSIGARTKTTDGMIIGYDIWNKSD